MPDESQSVNADMSGRGPNALNTSRGRTLPPITQVDNPLLMQGLRELQSPSGAQPMSYFGMPSHLSYIRGQDWTQLQPLLGGGVVGRTDIKVSPSNMGTFFNRNWGEVYPLDPKTINYSASEAGTPIDIKAHETAHVLSNIAGLPFSYQRPTAEDYNYGGYEGLQ